MASSGLFNGEGNHIVDVSCAGCDHQQAIETDGNPGAGG
jgi:hypothetical protein